MLRRRAARPGPERTRGPERHPTPGTAEAIEAPVQGEVAAVLDLQHRAGNRATAHLLRRTGGGITPGAGFKSLGPKAPVRAPAANSRSTTPATSPMVQRTITYAWDWCTWTYSWKSGAKALWNQIDSLFNKQLLPLYEALLTSHSENESEMIDLIAFIQECDGEEVPFANAEQFIKLVTEKVALARDLQAGTGKEAKIELPTVVEEKKDSGPPSEDTDVKAEPPSVGEEKKDSGPPPVLTRPPDENSQPPSVVEEKKDTGLPPSETTDVKSEPPSVVEEKKDTGLPPSETTDVKSEPPSVVEEKKDTGLPPSETTDVKSEPPVVVEEKKSPPQKKSNPRGKRHQPPPKKKTPTKGATPPEEKAKPIILPKGLDSDQLELKFNVAVKEYESAEAEFSEGYSKPTTKKAVGTAREGVGALRTLQEKVQQLADDILVRKGEYDTALDDENAMEDQEAYDLWSSHAGAFSKLYPKAISTALRLDEDVTDWEGLVELANDDLDQANQASQQLIGLRGRWRSPQAARGHFTKHSGDTGLATELLYLQAAADIWDHPAGTVVTKVRPSDGDTLCFDSATGYFSARTSLGVIKTLFHPGDGIRYYNRQ